MLDFQEPISKSFYIKKDNFSGCAELSEIDLSTLESVIPITDRLKQWFYFNRLFVNHRIRKQGLGTKLMEEVIQWADENKYNIYLEINPYGEMGMNDLINFYEKFGFTQINDTNTMIRII